MQGSVILGLILSMCLAVSAEGKEEQRVTLIEWLSQKTQNTTLEWPEWPQLQQEEPRMLSATGDNMTIAFVPLISLIANLLPRFFNRLGALSPTMVQQARSFGKEDTICNKPEDEGLMWPDPDDSSRYYMCSFSQLCFMTNQESCFEVQHLKCDLPSVFSVKEQQCLPKKTHKQEPEKQVA